MVKVSVTSLANAICQQVSSKMNCDKNVSVFVFSLIIHVVFREAEKSQKGMWIECQNYAQFLAKVLLLLHVWFSLTCWCCDCVCAWERVQGCAHTLSFSCVCDISRTPGGLAGARLIAASQLAHDVSQPYSERSVDRDGSEERERQGFEEWGWKMTW